MLERNALGLAFTEKSVKPLTDAHVSHVTALFESQLLCFLANNLLMQPGNHFSMAEVHCHLLSMGETEMKLLALVCQNLGVEAI